MSSTRRRVCSELLALAALLGAGCYRPSYADCQFSCGSSAACPDDLVCQGGFCLHPGDPPTMCTESPAPEDPDAAVDDPGQRVRPDAAPDARPDASHGHGGGHGGGGDDDDDRG